ncbi:amino acid adenylation domain-containing protein [Clostridium cellulovorans]|uniref:Amino acid adenylation domain protein n=1 Tax=Clostridium cellulovorans (strain ATCC 35296 / DSM 3052 / OCM 3 / 743B) TaxID=573061 RepID=D9STT4_CLOC7|nr:amino acid adenylation domain-containing protein [Clostridium cellulovorans]ADL52818.1 amino acid adenylation domain protein [Clostridium cellulovorans 743B]
MDCNEIRVVLKEIWDNVLEKESNIEVDFYDNGGDSFKITLMIAEIQNRLNAYVELADVFFDSNFESIVEYINNGIITETRNNLEKEIENGRNRYKSSINQKNMFILDKQYKNIGKTYNMPVICEIKGVIDIKKLENACGHVFENNNILRTNFSIKGEEIYQNVHDKVALPFEVKQIAIEDFTKNIKDNLKQYDLEKDILIRFILIDDVWKCKKYLFIDQHHIISDGVSVNILLKKIAEAYRNESIKCTQYDSFVNQQIEWYESEEANVCKKYWRNQFENWHSEFDFPKDGLRKGRKTFSGVRKEYHIDEQIICELNTMAKKYHTTLNTIMFTAFSILVYKYSLEEEFCIATTSSGREYRDINDMLGIFINSIPIKFKICDEYNYEYLIEETKQRLKEAYKYQKYSYSNVIEDLGLSGNIGRTPLFDIGFLFQNMENAQVRIDDNCYFDEYEYVGQGSRFEWMLEVNISSKRTRLVMEYNTDLYKQERMDHIIDSYKTLLKQIIASPDKKVEELNILTSRDKEIIYENIISSEMEINKTIIEQFYENLKNNKNSIAVHTSKGSFTYEEINIKSNYVAEYLIKNYSSEDVIGILLNRTEEIIIAYLGVLKAGCAFLPIDLNQPIEKINYMLSNSNAQIILSQQQIDLELSCKKIDIEELYCRKNVHIDIENLYRRVPEENLAYILYTSGSTGASKGVMIEYSALNNFILGMKDIMCDINTVLAITSVGFDISLLELIVSIIYGRTVVIVDEKERLNDKELYNIISKYNVDFIQITPSRLNLLISHEYNVFENIKKILIGGEMLIKEDIEKLGKLTHAKIYNMYGPTETTIWSTYKEIGLDSEITAGKPIVNTSIFVLDKRGRMLPHGVAGQLYIGGKGLARGYVNNKTETDNKFVLINSNSLINDVLGNTQILYATGDLAKFNEFGELIILGRMDNQVKLNGHRIELDDIRKCIMSYNEIENAVVLCCNDSDGSKYLVCYYISPKEISPKVWHGFLTKSLPRSIIPTHYIRVNEFPTNNSGKIDYKKLKEIKYTENQVEIEEFSELQQKIKQIWSKLLGIDEIGLNDNFYEIGGNSLKAIRLLAEFERENIISDNIDVFTYNTIYKISIFLEGEIIL